jgi:hypothetical protein
MPGDATILEGPVTPAPIFAYRALRSIFFASPDSPDFEHVNKENIAPTYASPSKSKTVISAKSPQLTPSQKRKRDSSNDGPLASPTKGILRTPGLATPRMKALRDVNVKFKSISPEVRLENVLAEKAKFPLAPAQDGQQPQKSVPTAKSALPPKQTAQSQVENMSKSVTAMSDSTAALETYMLKTEKEMKRLVKYSQKMREYARRKDAENAELKIMVQRLRKENERLASGQNEQKANTDGGLFDVMPNVKDQGKDDYSVAQAKEGSKEELNSLKAVSPALRNKHKGYVKVEVNRVEATMRKSQASSLSKKGQAMTEHKLAERLKPQTQARALPSDFGIDDNGPMQLTLQAPSSRTSSAPSVPSAPTAPPTRSVSMAVTSSRPPESSTVPSSDRLAAARERLRQRSMARRASQGLVPVEDAGKENVPSPGDVQGEAVSGEKNSAFIPELEEPSTVDWLNL